MSPISKASLALITAAIANLASASTLLAFPAEGCDMGGYYTTITADRTSCTETYLTDSDYMPAANNSNMYQVWYSLQTEEDQGCALVIGMDSTDASAPPCGECVVSIQTSNTCTLSKLPTPFYTWECCGSECDNQCGGIPGKRHESVESAVEALKAREDSAKASRTTPDIANLKNRSPLSSAPLAKRSDCAFTPAQSDTTKQLYTQAGDPYKVSNSFQTCPSSNGCMESYSGTIESSFSQTFDVSETTEAGFFDVVSESVTFGYSATWESSQSITVSGSYTFDEGQSGYITFSPLSQCVDGTFAGADCSGMGIPTGGDARQACVPQHIAGQMPDGDINVVQTI